MCLGSVPCFAASRTTNARCMPPNRMCSSRSTTVDWGTALHLTPYRRVLNCSSVGFKLRESELPVLAVNAGRESYASGSMSLSSFLGTNIVAKTHCLLR